MALLVIGGHCRSVGKTSLIVDVIGAFPEARWTAIKITLFGHNICSANGRRCDCAPRDSCSALQEEHDRNGRTDTSRFLAAGAARVCWLRARQGALADALPLFERAVAGTPNVIVESNSLVDLVQPDLYVVALHPAHDDFKESARRFVARAEAFVLRAPVREPAWPVLPSGFLAHKPAFVQPLGEPPSAEFLSFLRTRLWGEAVQVA